MSGSYLPRTMTASFGRTATMPFYETFDVLRDQTQTMVKAPSFMPFKFEPRRARIDWRLLHGVDINTIVRCALKDCSPNTELALTKLLVADT